MPRATSDACHYRTISPRGADAWITHLPLLVLPPHHRSIPFSLTVTYHACTVVTIPAYLTIRACTGSSLPAAAQPALAACTTPFTCIPPSRACLRRVAIVANFNLLPTTYPCFYDITPAPYTAWVCGYTFAAFHRLSDCRIHTTRYTT